MSRTRVHNLFVSLDGYAAGEEVTFDAPIGGARQLFGWFDGRVIHGIDRVDDPVTLDRALFSTWGQGIGAEIMGRRKFGPQTGEWPDDGWQGWWGDEPPFRTPVFVMTHHERPSIEFPNGTSFHFVNAPPGGAGAGPEGRERRRRPDRRRPLGGPPVPPGRPDRLHAPAILPITRGRGVSLWEGFSGLEDRFTVETLTSPSGITHQLWNSRNRATPQNA